MISYSIKLLTVFALLASPFCLAGPIQFDITGGSWSQIGSGYGIGSESTLDVRFTDTFNSLSFTRSNVGDSSGYFSVGHLVFNNESDINILETDNLEISWSFDFANPLIGTRTLSTNGQAFTGTTYDPENDFTIDWAPLIVDFGQGGRFEIQLTSFRFGISYPFELSQMAKITLLELPNDDAQAVPESGSLVILGLGLLGIGIVRRLTI